MLLITVATLILLIHYQILCKKDHTVGEQSVRYTRRTPQSDSDYNTTLNDLTEIRIPSGTILPPPNPFSIIGHSKRINTPVKDSIIILPYRFATSTPKSLNQNVKM